MAPTRRPHALLEPQTQMVTTILLKTVKKALFFTIPVTAIAGNVVAGSNGYNPAYGLLIGGLGPLALALFVDWHLSRNSEKV